MQSRAEFPHAKRVIVKIGSALLTGGGRGLDLQAITGWVAQLAALRFAGLVQAAPLGVEQRWMDPYRHWLFRPTDGVVKPEFAKKR